MDSEYPETIYLVPTDLDGPVWETEPAPGEGMDPADAVRYVRADTAAQKAKREKYRNSRDTRVKKQWHPDGNCDCWAIEELRPATGRHADPGDTYWTALTHEPFATKESAEVFLQGYRRALTQQPESEPPLSYGEWKAELGKEDIEECGKVVERPERALRELYEQYLKSFFAGPRLSAQVPDSSARNRRINKLMMDLWDVYTCNDPDETSKDHRAWDLLVDFEANVLTATPSIAPQPAAQVPDEPDVFYSDSMEYREECPYEIAQYHADNINLGSTTTVEIECFKQLPNRTMHIHADIDGSVTWAWLAAAPSIAEKREPDLSLSDSYVLLPQELTAENGAKAALMGEFVEPLTMECSCCGGDGCDLCDGEGEYQYPVTVQWDTIKDIWRAAVQHFEPPVKGE